MVQRAGLVDKPCHGGRHGCGLACGQRVADRVGLTRALSDLTSCGIDYPVGEASGVRRWCENDVRRSRIGRPPFAGQPRKSCGRRDCVRLIAMRLERLSYLGDRGSLPNEMLGLELHEEDRGIARDQSAGAPQRLRLGSLDVELDDADRTRHVFGQGI